MPTTFIHTQIAQKFLLKMSYKRQPLFIFCRLIAMVNSQKMNYTSHFRTISWLTATVMQSHSREKVLAILPPLFRPSESYVRWLPKSKQLLPNAMFHQCMTLEFSPKIFRTTNWCQQNTLLNLRTWGVLVYSTCLLIDRC